MKNNNQMVEAFNKVIADSGIQIDLWRDYPTEKWKAMIDTSEHDKQIRADAIDEFVDKFIKRTQLRQMTKSECINTMYDLREEMIKEIK